MRGMTLTSLLAFAGMTQAAPDKMMIECGGCAVTQMPNIAKSYGVGTRVVMNLDTGIIRQFDVRSGGGQIPYAIRESSTREQHSLQAQLVVEERAVEPAAMTAFQELSNLKATAPEVFSGMYNAINPQNVLTNPNHNLVSLNAYCGGHQDWGRFNQHALQFATIRWNDGDHEDVVITSIGSIINALRGGGFRDNGVAVADRALRWATGSGLVYNQYYCNDNNDCAVFRVENHVAGPAVQFQGTYSNVDPQTGDTGPRYPSNCLDDEDDWFYYFPDAEQGNRFVIGLRSGGIPIRTLQGSTYISCARRGNVPLGCTVTDEPI